jgi:small-conductance mechanosensitive channel
MVATGLAGPVAQDSGDPATSVAGELGSARDRAEGLFDTLVEALPRVGIAAAIVLVAWLLSLVLRRMLTKRWDKTRTPSFAKVMSRLAGWGFLALGVLGATTVAFPSVDPVDVVAGLGVVSIAAGFAFQDVLSNLLSGLLLITRQPFVSGDQIRIGDHEGTVKGITVRETEMETYEGRYVQIPNKDVYQNSIVVQTANDAVRSDLVVGCSYDDDLKLAHDTAVGALHSVRSVCSDPPPVARFSEFGDSSIALEVRYWTGSTQAEIVDVRHEVVLALKSAFDEAGLDIPWPIRTLAASDSLREMLSVSTGERSNGGVARRVDT